jgi:hypothetical protein
MQSTRGWKRSASTWGLTMTDRETILRTAEELINGNRHAEYGPALQMHQRIGALWSAYLGHEVSPVDVAMMMVLLKASRIKVGGSVGDSFVDIAGYSAIAGEMHSDLADAAK